MADLERSLAGSVTLLVGQSGVGKSSLVNALSPDAAAQTAELTRDVEGRHTTTTARWYRLAANSAIIDAPGRPRFRAAAQAWCARPSAASSRSTGSASTAASRIAGTWRSPVAPCARPSWRRQIAPRRYESYRRLFRLYEKLAP